MNYRRIWNRKWYNRRHIEWYSHEGHEGKWYMNMRNICMIIWGIFVGIIIWGIFSGMIIRGIFSGMKIWGIFSAIIWGILEWHACIEKIAAITMIKWFPFVWKFFAAVSFHSYSCSCSVDNVTLAAICWLFFFKKWIIKMQCEYADFPHDKVFFCEKTL